MTIDLDKLRKAAERATQGPWRHYSGTGIETAGVSNTCVFRIPLFYAPFIAAASPSTVLALIERVEKAEAALKLALPALEEELESKKLGFFRSDDEEYIRPVREAEEAVREALR